MVPPVMPVGALFSYVCARANGAGAGTRGRPSGDKTMTDLLQLRRHRFDALHALFVRLHNRPADTFMPRNHLRRDVGLPEAPTPALRVDLTAPLVGLRR